MIWRRSTEFAAATEILQVGSGGLLPTTEGDAVSEIVVPAGAVGYTIGRSSHHAAKAAPLGTASALLSTPWSLPNADLTNTRRTRNSRGI